MQGVAVGRKLTAVGRAESTRQARGGQGHDAAMREGTERNAGGAQERKGETEVQGSAAEDEVKSVPYDQRVLLPRCRPWPSRPRSSVPFAAQFGPTFMSGGVRLPPPPAPLSLPLFSIFSGLHFTLSQFENHS